MRIVFVKCVADEIEAAPARADSVLVRDEALLVDEYSASRG